MASSAWPSITIRCLLLVFIALFSFSPGQPVIAENAGDCQSAYGTDLGSSQPGWLEPVKEGTDLTTQNRYDLLAAHLLSSGIVNGGTCPGNGLNSDGSTNACGLISANSQVIDWQNQYDPVILSSSQTTGIPPRVVKAVISVESQFWPGANWEKGEVGLGQMTENGADLLLTYRPEYYRQVCAQVLNEKNCTLSYSDLDYDSQSMLRGAVLKSIDATCPGCSGGVNPEKGNQSVLVLSESLAASCKQSARLISIVTGSSPAGLMNYEDYWRFVLANYHSGAGCMLQALRRTDEPSSWSSISAGFPIGCSSGTEYVRRIEEAIKP